ncbi:MAG: hypothetical protein JWM81_451 [Candidatus Saccharibacteria bacterium]|nr:hypothetical protein [Candidatus Saccharibacteria bacterium]
MKKPSTDKPDLTKILGEVLAKVSRFRLLIFIALVCIVYGYILFTITSLSNAQPTDTMVSAQKSPITSARVDKKVISQLRQLQDNSVSVQELFNQARDNPFQE